MTISERNGIAVILNNITFYLYTGEDNFLSEQVMEYIGIVDVFETSCVSAYSMLQTELRYVNVGTLPFYAANVLYVDFVDAAVYVNVLVKGTDKNNQLLEISGRVDFLPQ